MYVPTICPECGHYIRPRVWYEDGALSEYVLVCPCGYSKEWSYGISFKDEDDDENDD